MSSLRRAASHPSYPSEQFISFLPTITWHGFFFRTVFIRTVFIRTVFIQTVSFGRFLSDGFLPTIAWHDFFFRTVFIRTGFFPRSLGTVSSFGRFLSDGFHSDGFHSDGFHSDGFFRTVCSHHHHVWERLKWRWGSVWGCLRPGKQSSGAKVWCSKCAWCASVARVSASACLCFCVRAVRPESTERGFQGGGGAPP